MIDDSLYRGLPMMLLIGAVVALFWYRGRRSRADDKWDIFYATHSAAAETATKELRAVFEDMIPQHVAGVFLLRLSLLNRGEKATAPKNFHRPVRLTLPASSRILDVRAVQRTGTADFRTVTVSSNLNHVEIEPFVLPPRSSVIFNVVIDGAADPHSVESALDGQPELQKLM